MISSLYVYDSYQPDGTETTEDFRHYTEDCLYRLEAVGENVYKITAVVSQAFLNHPETVYPVVIDPTISGTASTMDDAFISPTVTGASNYKASYLRVGKNGNDHYAFLRFGNLPSKPANVDVASATLKLTYRPNQTTGGALNCHYAAASWVGKDLTWVNKPARVAPGRIYDPQGRNYSIASFDAATYLQNWTNGGRANNGLCIAYDNPGLNDYNSVYSSDGPAGSVPRIEYSYTGAYGTTSGISSGTIYYLRNVRSGKMLDVQGDGYNVVQYPYHGGASQQWKVVYIGNGFYSLIPMFKQSARLDVSNANDINGTNVGVWQENGNNAQQFRIIPCTGGSYRLQSKISTRKVLDVCGASTANNANVQIWDYVNAGQQQWFFEPCIYGNYSCAMNSLCGNPKRTSKLNQANKDFDNWPAAFGSAYAGFPAELRSQALTAIRSEAMAVVTAGGLSGVAPAAAEMLTHYLGKTGSAYTVNFNKMIMEWEYAKNKRNSDIDEALEAAENLSQSNKSVTFYRTSEIEHTDKNNMDGVNWKNAIGNYSTNINCIVYSSGNTFSAHIYYYIFDVYDFEKSEEKMGYLPVSPRDMWELHHGGLARAYYVHGEVHYTVSWTKGQRVRTGLTLKTVS